MKKLLLLFLVPLFAISQTNPNREYWQTNKWSAKKGMNTEFEAAVAKKTQKYNNTKETSFATYQIITGSDQGKYMRVMGNRSAAAFDTEDSAELAYWMKNVMPYTEGNDGNVRWWRMKGAGQNWNNDLPPARFIKMTTYNLKRDNSSDFFRFWRNNVKLQKSLGYSGVNYIEEYNKMFGWRSHRNDQAAFNASIEQWGIIVETAELKPEMSSKLK